MFTYSTTELLMNLAVWSSGGLTIWAVAGFPLPRQLRRKSKE